MQSIPLKILEPRWYQTEATNSIMGLLDKNDINIHPIVVAPTASGKSLMICDLIDRFLTKDPNAKILVLSHIKEILNQDFEALCDYFSNSCVALYSAGLGFRDIDQITVAGIQSVYNKPELFEKATLVIIDECHLITIKNTGMYRKLLSKLNANYVGFTATHFRLGHGYIHKGKGALFTDIAYDMSKPEIFNLLIEQGYLCNLITRATDIRMDTEGIPLIAKDYAHKALSDRFDRDEITQVAIKEIVKYGKNYKKWLVFAIDIKHAEHIASEFRRLNVQTACVHSKMEGDRDKVIEEYRNGKYRVMVNVDILTTGLNVPDIDLIALLRPTKSPVIHVQTIGRGLRVAPGKTHCLILDFAQNTSRLGPINDVVITQKEKGKGKGVPIIKECPSCQALVAPAVRICPICGYEFKFKTNLTAKPGTDDVIRKTKENRALWHDVSSMKYRLYKKEGMPNSMLVTYVIGIQTLREWVCPDHTGYAKYASDNWIQFRAPTGMPKPKDVNQLLEWSDWLKKPSKVYVNLQDKMPKIINVIFE